MSSLDLSKISVRDFNNPDGYHQGYPYKIINFDKSYYTNLNQAAIYGNVQMVYLGNQRIMALPDNYGFELKFGSDADVAGGFWRNVGTMAGAIWNGSGTPYPIILTGTAKIKW